MAPGILTSPGPEVAPLKAGSLAQLTEEWDDTIRFYLNGTKVALDSVDPELTLLEYLRGVGLTGTKLGCAEGGCGACTVVVSHVNPTTKKLYHASVNACLAPVISVDGKHVITVEGIGNVKNPHAVQQRIAIGNGSQCGFCTPGIVMSLYALIRNNPEPSEHAVEEAFDGNLCRCTGYRPILDAAQSFKASGVCGKSSANGGPGCCMEKQTGSGGCCKSSSETATANGDSLKLTAPEFISHRPDTELIFPPILHRHEFRPLVFGNKRKRWYRPVSLQQLLEIKHVHPDAKVIGGSTETQIETKFKAMRYSASVYVGDIPELRQFSFQDNHLEIGANVSLTDLESICDEALQRYGPVRGQPFTAIKKQLRYFAGRQIRNVASPAGNLATASPISDLNPVFVATNTVLVAKSLGGDIEIPMTEFFKGYRTTALPPDAIIGCLRVPTASENREYIRAYKQSKRKDDDIAIVNAALRVSLSSSHDVTSVNLVFGGMAPMTVSARKAEAFLIGKKFTHPATLEGTMSALEQDFDLQYGVPGGMASYRRSLALGFFYRFYHDVLSGVELNSTDIDHDVIAEIERAISSGEKDHEASAAYQQRVLGKAGPHVSALKQATGEAQYTDDVPVLQNELFGCMVLSTKPHAKIISVDPSAALDIPGVHDYVDHRDLPNPKANWWGAPVTDEVFFAVDKVTTAGQPIGMILAKSAKTAEEAARAVKIEYEELPAILTIEEAIETESFFEHNHYIKKGDTEAAFRHADRVITGVSRMGGQEHFYLETQACVAIPKPEDGEMEIWSGTQNPTETQTYVAQVTGVAANKIVSRVKRLGGGFGGKETRSIQLAGLCATAAAKTRRPVRCMLNRDEDIITSGQRHPFYCRWKVGVTNEGKLLALDADVYANGGHTQDLSAAVVDRSLSHIDGVYNIPNVHVRGRICKTNTVSNSAFRGFGGPQGMFMAESFMSEIADHLDIPVEKLRMDNMYKPGDKTHFNQELKDWHVPLMYNQVLEESSYMERRKAVEEYNKKHKWSKRGMAIIPTKFGISFTALFLNQAGALVHIYHDGSVLVAHGGVEMGQGLHTKMTMIAAEALGVPQSDVFISETATNTVANTSSTAASASSDLNGYAIFNACEQLNERLRPYREKMPNAPMKELAHAAYFDRVNLSAQGYYRTPDIGYVWGENTGQMFFYFTQGVTAAEVEIDTLTGDWTPLRADIKMDVGRTINPSIDYGQIEGAFIQGQGLFTTEESLWHRASGQVVTKGPGNYKIPGFRDIPQVFNVSLLKDVEWENLRTIQRSRGVGEPPLFMGSAVFFAIRDALKEARKQYNVHEVLSLRSPATPERIRVSCADPIIERARVLPKEGEKSFFVEI
ncbi:Molybdopterin-binding domain of aldehyde dehydrogenase-domain-containing protein [Aspergillus pseudotamarii]|uniref:xanthine dehydrogenase n=1 Tax=Aspergillus pseudotamarii TaxID=132259 RepID=A0A5N6SES8_ASPPS|nr:Molybdopterin-binding domain of aldehyde dehydrogenase-domain-containing protein [Aspergillus pseudotamarii]KAE8132359.1 Molybdopterin-binding domain of aldehyde dehydrogenase-domain-containing protein [Aspergillus pseudotamarii]